VPEILRGSEPRFEDMARYMESASEDLAHHFAIKDDELRLKTNIRGGPLSALTCRYSATNEYAG
jgi:hypothetical protein